MDLGAEAKVNELKSRDYCGKGALVSILDGGERVRVIPMMCKTWGCPQCGPRLGKMWIAVISSQKIERFMTLTCDPKKFRDPQKAVAWMKIAFGTLVRRIRARYGALEYAGVWELHKSGWPHFHVALKGCYIPQAWLSLQWSGLGVGRVVWISRVGSARECARYLGKYLMKGARRTYDHLGGLRLVQVSRGFTGKGLVESPDRDRVPAMALWVPARYGEVLEYLTNDLGLAFRSEDGRGVIELRAPPGGIWGKSEKGWKAILLAKFAASDAWRGKSTRVKGLDPNEALTNKRVPQGTGALASDGW